MTQLKAKLRDMLHDSANTGQDIDQPSRCDAAQAQELISAWSLDASMDEICEVFAEAIGRDGGKAALAVAAALRCEITPSQCLMLLQRAIWGELNRTMQDAIDDVRSEAVEPRLSPYARILHARDMLRAQELGVD